MTNAVQTERAKRDSAEYLVVRDWLAANGIDEFLPEDPTFMVIDDQIVYRGFQFKNDRRGHDPEMLAEAYLRILEEDRTVPLAVPLADAVRAAFDALETREACEQRCFLIEVVKGGTDARKAEAYRRRLGLNDRTRRVQLLSNSEPRTCLSITAQDGALHLKIGDGFIPEDAALDGAFVLEQGRIDSLMRDLPRLREWLRAENLTGK